MTQITLPLSSRASTDANLFADVFNNDNAIVSVVNGNLDNTNIAAGAAIGHAKLANSTAGNLLIANGSGVITGTAVTGDVTISSSGVTAIGAGKVTASMLAASTQSTYKTILLASSYLLADDIAATYLLTNGVAGTSFATVAGTGSIPPLIHFAAADYAVGSLTTKLRLRAQVAANATAPAINFTFGLYPVTIAGAADTLTFTPGTVVSGSTSAFTTPSASTITQQNSGDFTIPSDGAYCLGAVTSGTLANNSAIQLSAQLQVRNV